MEWIKIKNKHILLNKLSLKEIGVLVKMQCLAAHLERIPTEDEIKMTVPKGTLTTLQARLKLCSTSLQEVLDKVLEDVQACLKHRSEAKKRKVSSRINKGLTTNVTQDGSSLEEKRVEEKRVYTNKECDRFSDWKKIETAYPNKASITKAMQLYFASENINCDLVIKAIVNYKAHLSANEWKKPMNLERFLGEIDAWANYVEPEKPKAEPKKPEGRSYDRDNQEFNEKLEAWKKEAV